MMAMSHKSKFMNKVLKLFMDLILKTKKTIVALLPYLNLLNSVVLKNEVGI